MTESLATILSQTFEKYVVEEGVEVTEGDPNDTNLPNSSPQELRQEATSKQPLPGRHMDVDATVNDLLTMSKNMAPRNNSTEPVRLKIFWKLSKMT